MEHQSSDPGVAARLLAAGGAIAGWDVGFVLRAFEAEYDATGYDGEQRGSSGLSRSLWRSFLALVFQSGHAHVKPFISTHRTAQDPEIRMAPRSLCRWRWPKPVQGHAHRWQKIAYQRACAGAIIWAGLAGVTVFVSLERGQNVSRKNATAAEVIPADAVLQVAEGVEQPDEEEESGISLPTDRLKQRQFDRASRLIEDRRWSDAATLLDEILGADRDFFFRPTSQQRTWKSMKADASRLVGSLPQPGREAYELQFRARADRLLQQAIAAGDAAGVVAVARRWFHTPAGQFATLIAAIDAIESNQPLTAAAWLDRLSSVAAQAEPFEPTLSLMRAIAWWRAGDRLTAVNILEKARAVNAGTVRIGGKDLAFSFSSGGAAAWLTTVAGEPPAALGRKGSEWWLNRGDASRNGISNASRPLLVPRYRVPLTRHPQEATLLEKRRKDFADRDAPLLPAGTPLAVDGFILVHTPMGLLAIDFETGKRIWLQTGSASSSFADEFAEGGNAAGDGTDAGQPSSLQSVFDDATSGTMSSDGRLVFAVESDPAVMNPTELSAANGVLFQGVPNKASDSKRGNVLSAYDIEAKGVLRWRLPQANQTEKKQSESNVSQSWYMGAPLLIGDQLFVLVEEKKEIRLDVLESTAGSLVWSQPLVELDEARSIHNVESRPRRVAGLSPSFADGVLVCPTGEGAVVAVDLATRTLLWAYNYPLSQLQNRPNGMAVGNVRFQGQGRLIINGQSVNASGPSALGWRDSAVILSGGCVVLTPQESDALHCLDLHTGDQKWKIPRKDRLSVAGVHNGDVILVGRKSVESLALANAQSGWDVPLALKDASPSGRGILTASRLFLPLDTPEVVEIDLANGRIVGRSAARGGAVPGNLLAYRGEVVSQGVDSLDVFHQAVPLESQIDTALKQRFEKDQGKDSWATLWQGQLDLDRGAVARGLQRVREAHAAEPTRIPAEVVSEAILFGMQRDFAAAVPAWRESLESRGALPIAGLPIAKLMLRAAVDGFLRLDDLPEAWRACRQLLSMASQVPLGDLPLVEDSSDTRLSVGELRWMQGRLSDIVARATPPLREEIDAFGAKEVASTQVIVDPAVRLVQLGRLFEQFKRHASGRLAGQKLVDDLAQLVAVSPPGSEAARDMTVRRELLLMQLHNNNQGGSETAAETAVGNANAPDRMPGPAITEGSAANDLGAAWPVGKVEVSEHEESTAPEAGRRRMIPIPLDLESGSFVPGLRLGVESQPPSFVATDGFGRRVGEPFGLANGKNGGVFALFQPGVEAAAIGRVVIVRSGSLVTAYELSSRNGEKTRRLWTSSETSNFSAGVPMGLSRMARQRIQRNGNVPLGMRISEPDDSNASTLVQGVRALATGVPVYLNRSIQLHDPATGELLWARHRLPALSELIGDDDFLCLCPLDGQAAIVLSMVDGRIVRTCEMPRRERRLTTCGRRVVTIEPVATGTGEPHDTSGEQDYSRRIRLAIFDPVSLKRIELGEYAGDARATPVGVDRLAVVEPGGSLTLINLRAGSVTFQVQLPDMPSGCERLHVMPWQDRLLVIVGRQETQAEQEQLKNFGIAVALPQMMSPTGSEFHGLLTGSIWAVAHETGDMLWPVPATVVRHVLYRHQPSELPLLLFARQLPHNGRQSNMSVLCLDKRTGHAVYVDDEISAQPHPMFGCEMSGNPQKHSIVLACTGSDKVSGVELRFTGEPMAPRPPFQSAFKPPASGDLATEIQLWFKKIWSIPK